MSLIGRQSICDNNYMMFGYDIMFRDETITLAQSKAASITATILDRIINDFGPENIVGGYTGLIRVDCDFLETSLIYTLPKESFIIMILESSLEREELPEIIEKLAEDGYRFGINDIELSDDYISILEPYTRWLELVKIDTLRTPLTVATKANGWLHAQGVKSIASKVESVEVFENYQAIGVDYFEGYFIKRPHLVQGESFNPTQEQILNVWNLLHQDASTQSIVDAFAVNHALALQLMRFINSSFFSFNSTITSIEQIVGLIGRKMLGNWLLLMMIANRTSQHANHPLLLMVINRTEIMTGLLKLTQSDYTRSDMDTAYLVGMLSLIHLLLQMEHRQFLRKINVSDEIEEAMFEAQGKWGQLLTMTRYIENTDYEGLEPYMKRYGIDSHTMTQMISKAMERVNAFDEMMSSSF